MDDRDRPTPLAYATPDPSGVRRRASASRGAWNAAFAGFLLNAVVVVPSLTSGRHGENYGQVAGFLLAAVGAVVVETYGFLEAGGNARSGPVAILSDLLVAMAIPAVAFAATFSVTWIL